MCASSEGCYRPGDRLVIVEGPFSGMDGKFLGTAEYGVVRLLVETVAGPLTLQFNPLDVRRAEMTVSHYLSCCDTNCLVPFLRHSVFAPSVRRASLFGCACLRLLWRRLTPRLREGVETAERLAGAPRSKTRRQAARREFTNWLRDNPGARGATWHLALGVAATLAPDDTVWHAWSAAPYYGWPGPVCPAQLLRDIFGDPFRPAAIDPAWLSWNGGFLPRLAREIYDDRRFDDLPVLGDAFEDAGCTDITILDHCRGKEPHTRGCWVVDALLGLS
jgi:hypothetical protein